MIILIILIFIISIIGIIIGYLAYYKYDKEYYKDNKYCEKNLKVEDNLNYIPVKNKIIKYKNSSKMDNKKWVKYVDKLLFKNFAKENGVESAAVLLGPFNKAEDIRLEDIPLNCVIKLNNGSTTNIGIKDGEIIFGIYKGELLKNVWIDIQKYLNILVKIPWPPIRVQGPWIKYIEPKIFVEELLYPIPKDWKVWVFNGKAKIVQVFGEKYTDKYCTNYYDTNWVNTGARWAGVENKDEEENCEQISRPQNLEELIEIAELFAKDIEFVRVDFYIHKGKIFAGEMTFAPGGGDYMGNAIPDNCDKLFSSYWK